MRSEASACFGASSFQGRQASDAADPGGLGDCRKSECRKRNLDRRTCAVRRDDCNRGSRDFSKKIGTCETAAATSIGATNGKDCFRGRRYPSLTAGTRGYFPKLRQSFCSVGKRPLLRIGLGLRCCFASLHDWHSVSRLFSRQASLIDISNGVLERAFQVHCHRERLCWSFAYHHKNSTFIVVCQHSKVAEGLQQYSVARRSFSRLSLRPH